MRKAATVVLSRWVLILPRLLLCLISPQSLWAQANLENPAPGSVQSGISIVSSGKRTAGTITITIDTGPPAQILYGSSHADTQGVCGYANNGLGLLGA